MTIFCRYPKRPEVQALIQSKGFGAIIDTAWIESIYRGGFDNPEFEATDSRLASLPDGSQTHIHTLVNRFYHNRYRQIEPMLELLCWPIIERYRHRVTRWTLCNEMMLLSEEIFQRVKRFYKATHERFPELELWIGEYGLRSGFRSSGFIAKAQELRQECPGLKGLLFVDYIDLSSSLSNNYLTGVYQATKKSLVPMATKKISEGLTKARASGFQVALENSVFTGEDYTPYTWECQREIYQYLLDCCYQVGAEFWHWNIADSVTYIPWALGRNASDSPGWYDRDLRAKFELHR